MPFTDSPLREPGWRRFLVLSCADRATPETGTFNYKQDLEGRCAWNLEFSLDSSMSANANMCLVATPAYDPPGGGQRKEYDTRPRRCIWPPPTTTCRLTSELASRSKPHFV